MFTHTRGHTLDVVITNSAPLGNLQVYGLGESDHNFEQVTFDIPVTQSSDKQSILNVVRVGGTTEQQAQLGVLLGG